MVTSLPSAKPAETLTVKIADLSRGGSGVGRDDTGRVIFVPYTVPGDVVRARVVETKKHFAHGELIEILSQSPTRATPPCPVFGTCGGCAWQHVPYPLQWATKLSGAQQALKRVGHLDPTVSWSEYPAQTIWHYRNRVQLRGEGDNLGFFARESQVIVPIAECWIARPEINAALATTCAEGKRLGVPYKVEVEVLPDHTIRQSWNQRHAAQGFRQVHDEQNEVLRAAIGQWLPIKESADSQLDTVLFDLYGGSGNFSRAFAPHFAETHCVDLVIGQKDVQKNTESSKVHFHTASVVPWLERQKKRPSLDWGRLPSRRVALLDPPREGLGPDGARVAKILAELGCQTVILVGCDADAWARDCANFARSGNWKIAALGALDLFPQTPHVEALAKFVRLT